MSSQPHTESTPYRDGDEAFQEVIGLAAGAGAGPTQLLMVALAIIDADHVGEALDKLNARRADILSAVARWPCPHSGLAQRPAGKPRALMRLDIGDHEIRGHLLYEELLPYKSFMQVAALAIGGVMLSAVDALLLEKVAICILLADPRIWPLAIARRLEAMGRPFADRMLAGSASMLNPRLGAQAASQAAAVFDRVHAAHARGMTTSDWVDAVIASKERVAGIGRPLRRGRDERYLQVLAMSEAYGRREGRFVCLAVELDRLFVERKEVSMNAGGLLAALLRDLGFSTASVGSMVQMILSVALLMQATDEE